MNPINEITRFIGWEHLEKDFSKKLDAIKYLNYKGQIQLWKGQLPA